MRLYKSKVILNIDIQNTPTHSLTYPLIAFHNSAGNIHLGVIFGLSNTMEGTWRFTSGDALPHPHDMYTNWGPGEPASDGFAIVPGSSYYQKNWIWESKYDDEYYAVLCEKYATRPAPPP